MTTPYETGTLVSPDTAPTTPRTPRVWFPIAITAAYWAFIFAVNRFDLAISQVFLSSVGVSVLLTLAFIVWWLVASRVGMRERLLAFAGFIGGCVLAALVSDPSVGGLGIVFVGLPMVVTAWTGWLLVARRRSSPVRLAGILAAIALPLAVTSLVRVEGIDGDSKATTAWRWAPTAEEEYLKQREAASSAATADEPAQEPLVATPGDWTEFRGPNRQGELHGTRIATDWSGNPPRELWRRRIGPAWSSMLIVGDRLFTQEQRGDKEATVCLAADTGQEIWSHEDAVRFSDGQAGAGPRGTPTFDDGRIYGLGGTGVLNCLDARTGKPLWSRDIAADSKAPLPMWGFSSSPLVVDGLVIVYAGGPGDKGMLAYRAGNGELAWSVPTGPVSYSSPQLAELDGKRFVLLLSDSGLSAVDLATGKVAWEFASPSSGIWRVVQPRQLDASTLLVGSEDLGLTRLALSHEGKAWSASEKYKSKAIRPAYNDFVVTGGNVYGFDEAIFCCVDAETGKRRWKSGRYGHGQVLLLADQSLLVVLTESGEVVLLKASPDKHEEISRFQAIEGKTWNHPVIARDRLFVRNDLEMACFELRAEGSP